MSMDNVSVEAFDRTAMALVKVIQEDAQIIEGMRKDIEKHAEAARRSWDNYNEAQIEVDALKSKVADLLDLCVAEDVAADEMRVSRQDRAVSVNAIREILAS